MPLVGLVVLGMALLASAAGVRVGERLRPGIDERALLQHNTIQASLLGLLALLLGFSFAMAASRFDVRKQMVLAETVAIGTADLRTRAIPDPPGGRIHALLGDYVKRRLALYRRGASAQEELASTGLLERQAWPLVAALAREDPRSVPAGLLMQSLNEVIDLNAKRVAVINNRVPIAVWMVLVVVSALAMGWSGMCLGISGSAGLATRVILALSLAFVTAMIVDLDQPRRGLIRISQEALQHLDASLREVF